MTQTRNPPLPPSPLSVSVRPPGDLRPWGDVDPGHERRTTFQLGDVPYILLARATRTTGRDACPAGGDGEAYRSPDPGPPTDCPQVSPTTDFRESFVTDTPTKTCIGAVMIVAGVAGAFVLFDHIASGYLREVILSSVRQHAAKTEAMWAITSKQMFASTICTGARARAERGGRGPARQPPIEDPCGALTGARGAAAHLSPAEMSGPASAMVGALDMLKTTGLTAAQQARAQPPLPPGHPMQLARPAGGAPSASSVMDSTPPSPVRSPVRSVSARSSWAPSPGPPPSSSPSSKTPPTPTRARGPA